jgi:hypothetical protein
MPLKNKDPYDGFMKSLASGTEQPKKTIMLYCVLFSDMIPETLCQMRKRDLGSKGVFFCEACDQL